MMNDEWEYASPMIKAEILKPARTHFPSKLDPSTWCYDLIKDELSFDKTLSVMQSFGSVSLNVLQVIDERLRETTSDLRKASLALILRRDGFF